MPAEGLEPPTTAVATLGDDLIHAERWTPERVQRLVDDVWACGPREAFGLPIAA